MSILNDNEIPIGFGMALAQNLDAMNVFTNLSEQEKNTIVTKSRNASSKQEMENLVSELSSFQ